jgi:hypothetical protein
MVLLMGFFILFVMVYMHESVHVEIYKSYGIKSSIHFFKYFPSIVTEAETKCPNSDCELAHNVNDTIGYHLIPFYIMVLLMGFFIVVTSEERNVTARDN